MSNFSLQVNRWLDKVKIDTKTFTKLVAFKVHDRIVERTPVDTGRARASWTIVAGEVADRSVAPEGYDGKSGPAWPASKGMGAILPRGVGLDSSYVIANSLPYIEALENGDSKQAPAGMVPLAIADIRTELERDLGA